jgi:hypothetical protein
MPTVSLRSRLVERCPRWLLLPGAALAISALGMLLVCAIVSVYAIHGALTRGAVDPARIDAFASATGARVGPATSLALAFLVARWLVTERRLGHGVLLVLAALLTAIGAAIDWAFGDAPDAAVSASGLLFAGATALGGWLGRRDLAAV